MDIKEFETCGRALPMDDHTVLVHSAVTGNFILHGRNTRGEPVRIEFTREASERIAMWIMYRIGGEPEGGDPQARGWADRVLQPRGTRTELPAAATPEERSATGPLGPVRDGVWDITIAVEDVPKEMRDVNILRNWCNTAGITTEAFELADDSKSVTFRMCKRVPVGLPDFAKVKRLHEDAP